MNTAISRLCDERGIAFRQDLDWWSSDLFGLALYLPGRCAGSAAKVAADKHNKRVAYKSLAVCMPCRLVSSDDVALGLVAAAKSCFDVWGRLARSDEIWARWSLNWSWVAGPPDQGRFSHDSPNHPDDTMTLEIDNRVVAIARSASML